MDVVTGVVKKHHWLTALLDTQDFAAAELLVKRMESIFGKIFALTELASAYHRHGMAEKARVSLGRALKLWQQHQHESCCLMLVGCILRSMSECGQVPAAEQLMPEIISLVHNESEEWLKVHGWCGLASGAISLGQPDLARSFFVEAIRIAENRDTEEKRVSAWMVIHVNLEAVGWEKHDITGRDCGYAAVEALH